MNSDTSFVSSGLPSGWTSCTLAEVGDVVTGNTPPTYESDYYGGATPFIKPTSLQDRPIMATPEAISERGEAYTRVVPADSVLVSCIGNLGRTGLTTRRSAFNQQINGVVFRSAVYPRFGFYACQTLKPFLEKESSATTIAIVNKSKFSQAHIPIPPLPEQHRIVAEIERQFSLLDAGVTNLQRVQANLKRYRASVLQAACTGQLVPTEAELARAEGRDYEPAAVLLTCILAERRARWEAEQWAKKRPPRPNSGEPEGEKAQSLPFSPVPPESGARGPLKGYKEPAAPETRELPEGWTWSKSGQLAEVGTGATPLRNRAYFYEGGTIPWVTSGALNHVFVDQAEEYITERAIRETNAKVFPSGTLLVAMYGEGKTRGKTSELRVAAATNQACAALTLSGLAAECKPYVKLFLLKNYEEIRRLSSGGVQPNLNLSIVRETPVPLPPLAEQQRIVAEVERRLSVVDNLEQVVKANLKRAERLRQAILKEAFAGRLVPQDPNDEPASVLLERIKAEREAEKKPPRPNSH